MYTIKIFSTFHEEMIEITSKVNDVLMSQNVSDGICLIYTPHTTAGITINENADPDVKEDMLKGLKHLNFESVNFSHAEGNSPAHLKSSIIGCSELVIIEKGKPVLGTWQGIYFCEFDGPRSRKIFVKII